MPESDVFIQRKLDVVSASNLHVLDCVGWPDPLGEMGVRVFLQSTKVAALPTDQRFPTVKGFKTGVMLAGAAARADHLRLELPEGGLDISVTPPETDLFAGLNCCICEWSGEHVDVIADWLAYHVTGFDLQGVVLVDRVNKRNNKELAKLSKVLNASGLKRALLLSVPVPLGEPDLPASAHPFNAPDAPGKDRMGTVAPDPWTAPMDAGLIYELLRWRYLGRAQAVMNLDLCDLLQSGQNPFEAVHASARGVLDLMGQRIYPWRVRKGQRSKFGDHICRQFDNPRANKRWCIAPARLVPANIWRSFRIVEAVPEPDEQMQFWRAMSIRHAAATVSEIVPKTSLIEDEVLLRNARQVFDHKPVRPPVSKVDAAPRAAAAAGRTCIVTCMKNEGPFILEWIAYHRAIGVDDFLIYTNDCTDGTVELLDLLQARGIVQRRDNPFDGSGLKPQHAALKAAEDEPVMRDCGWGISMDVDEFINIHVGDGRLDDLYRAVGNANMISLTWRLFGNANVHDYEDRFLIDQFTRCAPELCRKPHQAWGFKTLFRNIGIYKKMGVHRPKGLKPDLWDQITWVNGSGKPMPQKLLRNGWRSTVESYGYDLVTLNHYAVRSAESFLVKRDRGRVNHVDRDQGLSYWFRMNNNWEEDRSIQRRRALLVEEYDRLMADPEIAAAHGGSVTAHRAKIAELRATQNYARFYAELTAERMERLSQLHTYFGANVFLAGPEVVPDEVALRDDHPSDFFFTVERAKTTH